MLNALQRLGQATPAKTSYVSGFHLLPGSLALLPPTLTATFSSIDADAAYMAESKGKSWLSYQPRIKAKLDHGVLVVGEKTWEVRLKVVARADFDGDGIDDLLISIGQSATQGTFASTKLLLMTRMTPTSRLVTLERLQ